MVVIEVGVLSLYIIYEKGFDVVHYTIHTPAMHRHIQESCIISDNYSQNIYITVLLPPSRGANSYKNTSRPLFDAIYMPATLYKPPSQQ